MNKFELIYNAFSISSSHVRKSLDLRFSTSPFLSSSHGDSRNASPTNYPITDPTVAITVGHHSRDPQLHLTPYGHDPPLNLRSPPIAGDDRPLCHLPPRIPLSEYTVQVIEIASKLLKLFAKGLGLDEDYFCGDLRKDSHKWDIEERGAPGIYKLDRCPDINCYNDSADDALSDCTSKGTSEPKQPAQVQGINFP